MGTATVFLGRCPPLWRDLIRRLLQPELDIVDLATSAADAPPAGHASTGDVAYLFVGEAAETVARRSARTPAPVVLLSSDGRSAVRFQRGVPSRRVDDVSADELRHLLAG